MSHNFARTAAALAIFDYINIQFYHALDNDEDWRMPLGRLENAGRRVGHAFGLDTADINHLDTCEQHIRPDEKLRRWVKEWQDSL